MTNQKIETHRFLLKAGMTIDDVKKSNATALQKKYAYAFDTDGIKGFSQKEADLFNATTFSEKNDGTVVFWTRLNDGRKQGKTFNAKDNNIKFQLDTEVKPYIKKVKVKKSAQKQNANNVSFFDEKWSGEQFRKHGYTNMADWLEGKDIACTDGVDDGKISVGDGLKCAVTGIFRKAINHPAATCILIGTGIALIALSGGAAAAPLIAVGAGISALSLGVDGVQLATAKTDADKKKACENFGTDVITLLLTLGTVKTANITSAEAGVKSLANLGNKGVTNNLIAAFKAMPEAFEQSCLNIKGNALTLSTGTVYPNSVDVMKDLEAVESNVPSRITGFNTLKEGTTFKGANGNEVLQPKSVITVDAKGNLSQATVESVLNDYKLSNAQVEKLASVDLNSVINSRNLTPNLLGKLYMDNPKAAVEYELYPMFKQLKQEEELKTKDILSGIDKYVNYAFK